MVYDGQRVELGGDEGHVLTTDGRNAHVLWHTGVRAGQATLEDVRELVPRRDLIQASLDDSLEVGAFDSTVAFQAVAVRQAYDEGGPTAVLEQMVAEGHLSMLSDIGDEVYSLVTGRVRTSPHLRHVIAQLDEDEAEAVVMATSAALLQDLLKPEE